MWECVHAFLFSSPFPAFFMLFGFGSATEIWFSMHQYSTFEKKKKKISGKYCYVASSKLKRGGKKNIYRPVHLYLLEFIFKIFILWQKMGFINIIRWQSWDGFLYQFTIRSYAKADAKISKFFDSYGIFRN